MWGDWAVQGIGKGSQQLGFLEGDASIGPTVWAKLKMILWRRPGVAKFKCSIASFI